MKKISKKATDRSRRESWDKWWATNAKDVLEKRKEKYRSDSEYRNRVKRQSKLSWDIGETKREKSRVAKIRAAKARMQADFDSGKTRRLNPRLIAKEDKKITVFPMVYLAVALGAEKHSVKRWTQVGIFPKPTHTDSENRYWYSREYIESLEKVYEITRSRNWGLADFKRALKIALPDAEWV